MDATSPRPPDPGPAPPAPRITLPAAFAADVAIQAFATAVDGMLAPIDQALSGMADNFRPFQSPAALLPYLVRLSRARVEPSWPERAVRAAIDLAAWLDAHRGTPAAMLREARVVYGWTLVVTDPGGVRLPADATAWPVDARLWVELDPVTAGPDPVGYDQGTLERLVDAHLPVSSARVLAPPPGKCALYEGPYSTGRAVVLSRDVADLATVGFDNRTASVWNRTPGIIGLYDEVAFGSAGAHQYVPAQQAVNTTESITKRTSSVRFLTTVPDGSWGLFDDVGGKGNLLGVYDKSEKAVAQAVAAGAKSLVNNTKYTLEAFAAPGVRQLVYPGVAAALGSGLSQALASVTVYTEVPSGAFCLYERPRQGGKQWMLWTQPGGTADLTPLGAGNQVSSVYNRTAYTLELFAAADGTGISQLFYPGAFADVSTAGLDHRGNGVIVRNGPPPGYYCLYDGRAKAGRQWVFADVANRTVVLTDAAILGANVVSSVQNNTSHTLELFSESNASGISQLFYPGLSGDVTVAGLDRKAKAVTSYDGARAGYYCLYASPGKTGTQWVFRDTATRVTLTDAAIGAGAAASVDNKTSRTLELFLDAAGTGTSQLVYPGLSGDLGAALTGKAKSAAVYDGPPTGYYCLYEGRNASGRQWVLPGTAGERNLTAPDVAAVGISEVRNQTTYTLELFQNVDKTGLNQMFYPGRTTVVQGPFDDKAAYAKLHDGPPDGYYCLYGTSPSAQWVLRGTPGTEQNLTDIGADSKVSRVFNNTRQTLELFQGTDASGRYQLFYPRKDTQANADVRNATRLVRCYSNCPNGYYCLYEDGNLGGNQYVFRDDVGDLDLRRADVDANDKISSVRNLTRFTIQLYADPGPSGAQQYCYPSQDTNVRGDLNDRTTIVRVLDGPPPNCYCLYEDGAGSGRQWIFSGNPGSEQNLTAAGVGASGISTVYNRTAYTLELFENTDKSGAYQMFYPLQLTSASGGFNDRARYARLHDAGRYVLPSGYFCLFADANFQGTQWVFHGQYNTRVRLADIGAARQVSSIGNNTSGKVTIYSNDNCTGWDWKTYRGSWHDRLQAYFGVIKTEDMNDLAMSVSWDPQ